MKITYQFDIRVKDDKHSIEEQQTKLAEFRQTFAPTFHIFYAFFKKRTALDSTIINAPKDETKLILSIKMAGSLPLEDMYHLTAMLEHYSRLLPSINYNIKFSFQQS